MLDWMNGLTNTVLVLVSALAMPLTTLRQRLSRHVHAARESEAQIRARNRRRQARAVAHLQQWMAEDSAMTPDQKAAAAAEWEQVKVDLNTNRLSDRPLFP